MSIDLLKKSLENVPILELDNYHYIIHPISDGIPEIFPDLLKEIIDEFELLINKCGSFDKIVTIESMGIPIATALSMRMNIPFTIIRKRAYNLPEEIVLDHSTGYSKSKLYINSLKDNEEIIIVDDIISTGNTIKAVLSGLNELNVVTKGIYIVIDKGNAIKKIKNEYNIKIHSLIKIDIKNGKVIILEK